MGKDATVAGDGADPDALCGLIRARSRPIRLAITVARIVGYIFNSSRIRGSTASTTDPARLRLYFGGPCHSRTVRT